MQEIQGRLPSMAREEFPGFEMTYHATTRSQAMIRSLRVLNAIQARAPAGATEAPKLSGLGLPAEATVDPFNGEPLHVKRLPQGWLVYSVGWDLQDHGGTLDGAADFGVGPPPAARPAEKSGPAKQ